MIEVKGRTQTERLIYLALKTEGQLRHAELQDVVGGNPEHLSKTLRTMQRDGLIRRVPNPPSPIGIGMNAIDIRACLDRPYEVMTNEQRAEWLTPFIKNWHRDKEGNLVGSHNNGQWVTGSPDSVRSPKDLEETLDHLRRKTWFRAGDEIVIRRLFPNFTTDEAVSA
jgi:hypothetical protein